MRQPATDLSLAAEAPHELRVAGKALAHDLDRHVARQSLVPGPIDGCHPARANALEHAIAAAEQLPQRFGFAGAEGTSPCPRDPDHRPVAVQLPPHRPLDLHR